MMTTREDWNICAACSHDTDDHVDGLWDCLVEGCGCHVVMDE